MPIEKVTKGLLEREINSRMFLDGLEKAIEVATLKRDIVNGKALEVGFDVNKELFRDKIFYPFEITIGTHNSVGGDIGEKFAEELYIKKTGRDPNNEDNLEDFVVFCAEHNLIFEDYPNTQNLNQFPDYKNHSYYPILHLHTHPTGNITPSQADCDAMTALRKRGKKSGLYIKPLSIIMSTVNLDSNKKRYSMLFFQERKEKPLTEKEKQKAREYIRNHITNKKILSMKEDKELPEQRLLKLLTILDLKHTQKQLRNFYNCGLGYFKPGDSRIELDFDLGKFAYEIQVSERKR